MGDLSCFDQDVYTALAAYCFNEPVCWPRQELIAEDLGTTRLKVHRAIGRLTRAGWLRVKERRWSRQSRWLYNVYELLEPWNVSDGVAAMIVRRAHRRRHRRAWAEWIAKSRKSGKFAPMNTNAVKPLEDLRECRCRSCRRGAYDRNQSPVRRVWPGGRPPKDREAVERAARWAVAQRNWVTSADLASGSAA